MKIRVSLKMALFAFLSAIACAITNSFIGIVELGIVADALWFLSYICVVIWICKYIALIKRLGKNLVVTFFTFALALYAGGYSSIYSDLVEKELIVLAGEMLFYVAAIVCLASVLVLIGRWIFGNSDKNIVESDDKSGVQNNADMWTCVCGTKNISKFCSECGCSKVSQTETEEEAEEEAEG